MTAPRRSIPPQSRSFLRALAVVLGLFSVLRLAFLALHRPAFSGIGWAEVAGALLHGVRFDLASACLLLGAPFLLLHIPGGWRGGRLGRALLWTACAAAVVGVAIHLADLHYYGEAGRRLSYEAFLVRADPPAVLGMALSYRWTLALFVLLAGALAWAWARWVAAPWASASRAGGPIREAAWLLPFAAVIVLGVRGGLQLKPLRPSHAFSAGPPVLGHLALDPVFTVYCALKRREPAVPRWMPEAEAVRAMRGLVASPGDRFLSETHPLARVPAVRPPKGKPPNVVVMLLESWAAKRVGALGGPPGLTPEFDALAKQGRLFTNAYAAGLRSADGIAAVACSLPTFEDFQVLGTALEQDSMRCLGTLFREAGYGTLFLHGARTGSLGLDAFSRVMGFDKYVGKDEIAPKPGESDPVWGVYDGVALARLNEELRVLPGPFLAFWFSLSSHSPYNLPPGAPRFGGKAEGEPAFLDTIRYSDDALGRFFAAARREPYFKDTVFVLVADHTGGSDLRGLRERAWIPILLYAPGRIPPGRDARVASQLDLLPTLLELAGVCPMHHAFGRSLLAPAPGAAYADLFGLLAWFRGDRILFADMEGARGLYRLGGEPPEGKDLTQSEAGTAGTMLGELRAFVQLSRTLLRENRLFPVASSRVQAPGP